MIERIKVLPLAGLRRDYALQMRELADKKAQDRSEEHKANIALLFSDENPVWPKALPPAKACWDGREAWIWDGFQRLEVAEKLGCVNVPVMIRDGTRQDAAWLACSANASHGLPRTVEDLHRAIQAAIALKPGLPCRNYASHIGCHHDTVKKWIDRHGLTQQFPTLNKGQEKSTLVTVTKVDNEGGKLEDKKPDREPGEDDGDFDDIEAPGGGGVTLPEPVEDDEHQGESDSSAAQSFGLDELGLPIPGEAGQKAFEIRDLMSTARYHIAELAKLIDQIGHHAGGELLRSHYLKLQCETRNGKQVEKLHAMDLENLKRELVHWQPYAGTCPVCRDKPSDKCKVCYGLPYVTKFAWEHSPEKASKALLCQKQEDAA